MGVSEAAARRAALLFGVGLAALSGCIPEPKDGSSASEGETGSSGGPASGATTKGGKGTSSTSVTGSSDGATSTSAGGTTATSDAGTSSGGGADSVSVSGSGSTTGAERRCVPASYGGHDYLFCRDPASWPQARATCLAAAFDLVTVSDPAENAWLLDQAFALVAAAWWIGFSDADDEGAWVWSSGAPVTFTGWDEGEPNNQGREDCAAFRAKGDGTWNDVPCANTYGFICEGG